jgi:hypothetical protein
MFGRLRSPSGDMPPYRSSLTGVQLGVGADGKQLVIRTAVIPCYFDDRFWDVRSYLRFGSI